MRLADYLKTHNLTAAEFGRLVGVRRSTVGRWLSGSRSPRDEQMRRIIAATGGQVQPNDLFVTPEPKARVA